MKNKKSIYTDLVIELNPSLDKTKIIEEKNQLKVSKMTYKENHYTTISFEDITRYENFKEVQNLFIQELKKYIKQEKNPIFLIIGLGNQKSTPDSLGPNVIENILVTRYLFLLGIEEDGYSNVCSFVPNVTGNTGIETSEMIKSIIKNTNATQIIIIDSLKTNSFERLVKTIQITDHGISPGSGIGNKRKEISKKTMEKDIIAIGVPTVVDIQSLVKDKNKRKDNYIVTPTNIDSMIENLSILIGNGINMCLHKDFIRQKKK